MHCERLKWCCTRVGKSRCEGTFAGKHGDHEDAPIADDPALAKSRLFPRLHMPDAEPVRLDETLAEPGYQFSHLADVRQHLLAE
jgi:hypothetical protein